MREGAVPRSIKSSDNQWMVDLVKSAQQEVSSWPAWKKESFGVTAPLSKQTEIESGSQDLQAASKRARA